MLSGWAQKWRGVQDFSLGAPGLRIRMLAGSDAPHGATGRMRTWGEVADRGASRHAGRARHAVRSEMSALVVSQFSCLEESMGAKACLQSCLFDRAQAPPQSSI